MPHTGGLGKGVEWSEPWHCEVLMHLSRFGHEKPSSNSETYRIEKAFLSSGFQWEKIKHFLWSWLTVRSINLPQTIFWPKEICSLAFWNCYIQRPDFWPLLWKRYVSSSAKARTWHKSPVWHMHLMIYQNIYFKQEMVLYAMLCSDWGLQFFTKPHSLSFSHKSLMK